MQTQTHIASDVLWHPSHPNVCPLIDGSVWLGREELRRAVGQRTAASSCSWLAEREDSTWTRAVATEPGGGQRGLGGEGG